MFLAPLNYDRFFKKIFSDKRIAKRFLEDFFEVTIEEIELVSLDHKLTNEANLLKFDFRCKIDGEYIIVDMQQWYKQDIVQRFYLYHTANTVLQLEGLPTLQPTKEKKVKDYSGLLPVKTLIWMVHDNLSIDNDFSIHQMLPLELLELIQNDQYWQTDQQKLLHNKRTEILALLRNDAKNLPFLRSNQLIFAFQKNIVKNKKLKPYYQWFEFAEKTRDENNTKADFKEYDRDTVFSEMIRKLSHKSLDEEDLNFLHYYQLFEGRKDVFKKDAFKEGERTGLKKAKIHIKQAEDKAKQAENKAKQAEDKAKQAEDKAIIAMLKNTDFTNDFIANTLGVNIHHVQSLKKTLSDS